MGEEFSCPWESFIHNKMNSKANIQEQEFSHLSFAWIRKYFGRIPRSLFGQQVKNIILQLFKKEKKNQNSWDPVWRNERSLHQRERAQNSCRSKKNFTYQIKLESFFYLSNKKFIFYSFPFKIYVPNMPIKIVPVHL